MFLVACSDNGVGAEGQTTEKLLQYRWKVGTMEIDGLPFPTNSGGIDKIRITFAPTTYTYVYPAPPNHPTATQGTMLTLEGTWTLSEDKTKILLDRSATAEPIFEWTILELKPGIFKARYQAINPFNTSRISDYDFGYTIDI